jgi:hypothetical protein
VGRPKRRAKKHRQRRVAKKHCLQQQQLPRSCVRHEQAPDSRRPIGLMRSTRTPKVLFGRRKGLRSAPRQARGFDASGPVGAGTPFGLDGPFADHLRFVQSGMRNVGGPWILSSSWGCQALWH